MSSAPYIDTSLRKHFRSSIVSIKRDRTKGGFFQEVVSCYLILGHSQYAERENCQCHKERQGNLLSFFVQHNVKNFPIISNQL